MARSLLLVARLCLLTAVIATPTNSNRGLRANGWLDFDRWFDSFPFFNQPQAAILPESIRDDSPAPSPDISLNWFEQFIRCYFGFVCERDEDEDSKSEGRDFRRNSDNRTTTSVGNSASVDNEFDDASIAGNRSEGAQSVTENESDGSGGETNEENASGVNENSAVANGERGSGQEIIEAAAVADEEDEGGEEINEAAVETDEENGSGEDVSRTSVVANEEDGSGEEITETAAGTDVV